MKQVSHWAATVATSLQTSFTRESKMVPFTEILSFLTSCRASQSCHLSFEKFQKLCTTNFALEESQSCIEPVANPFQIWQPLKLIIVSILFKAGFFLHLYVSSSFDRKHLRLQPQRSSSNYANKNDN